MIWQTHEFLAGSRQGRSDFLLFLVAVFALSRTKIRNDLLSFFLLALVFSQNLASHLLSLKSEIFLRIRALAPEITN